MGWLICLLLSFYCTVDFCVPVCSHTASRLGTVRVEAAVAAQCDLEIRNRLPSRAHAARLEAENRHLEVIGYSVSDICHYATIVSLVCISIIDSHAVVGSRYCASTCLRASNILRCMTKCGWQSCMPYCWTHTKIVCFGWAGLAVGFDSQAFWNCWIWASINRSLVDSYL